MSLRQGPIGQIATIIGLTLWENVSLQHAQLPSLFLFVEADNYSLTLPIKLPTVIHCMLEEESNMEGLHIFKTETVEYCEFMTSIISKQFFSPILHFLALCAVCRCFLFGCFFTVVTFFFFFT